MRSDPLCRVLSCNLSNYCYKITWDWDPTCSRNFILRRSHFHLWLSILLFSNWESKI